MIKYGIKEDEYHNILIEEEFKGEYRRITVNKYDDMREFIFPTFDGVRNIVLEIEDERLIKIITKKAYKGWNLIVLVKYYRNLPKDIEEESKYKIYKTYQDKKEFMEKRLLLNRFVYKNKDIRDIMVRSLIIDPSKLKDVYRFHEYVGDDYLLEVEDVEGIFGGVEFHNLEDTCLGIITLRYKNKSIKQIRYFIEDRGYSSRWVMGKLKGIAMDLDYMYYLYLRGIILTPLSEGDYEKRVSKLGIKPIENWYGYMYQYKLLDIVKAINYNQVKKIIQEILNHKDDSDEGIYSLLLKVRLLGEKEGYHGIFNRQIYQSKRY